MPANSIERINNGTRPLPGKLLCAKTFTIQIATLINKNKIKLIIKILLEGDVFK